MRRDPLTHIPNTRALKEFFELQLPSTISDHRPVCFILLDLLDFGEMNNRFGEFRCDKFLQKLAPFIESQMRSNEPAFRISPKDGDSSVFRIHTGGDEFVIVIRGTETDAFFLLRRLVDEVGHESHLWGSLLGLEEFSPSFNVSVYQMIHSLDWLKSLPGNKDAAKEIRDAFPRAAESAEEYLKLLKTEWMSDLRNIETLLEDDLQSLLTSLFELKRMSKTNEHGLAYGSGMLSPSHKSFADIATKLSSQQDDFEFALKKFRSSTERLREVSGRGASLRG
nr:diguanylate cyclase [Salipiger pentaromativorans]